MNQRILESSIHPFGRSSYNVSEKVSDFVGRENELVIFRDFIQIISQSKMSLTVRLEGPVGVGKSTLFNYLKESIQKEKVNSSVPAHYLTRNTDILSTYFLLPSKVESFKDIWSGILKGYQTI